MTRIVVEDTWYVEPDELSEMVLDALRRIDDDICTVSSDRLAIQSFDTGREDGVVSSSGEGQVTARLYGREPAVCTVEFSTHNDGAVTDTGGEVTASDVSVRIVEHDIA